MKKKSTSAMGRKLFGFNYNPFAAFTSLAIMIIAIVITVFLTQQQQNLSLRAEGKAADIILAFDSNATKAGETMLVDISVDSYNTPIKEVQFNLTYPEGKAVPEISYDNSIFSIQNEELIGSGYIRLGRNADRLATGKSRIGTIKFRALDSIDASEINQVANSIAIAENEKSIPLYMKKEIGDSDNQNLSLLEKLILQIKNFFGSLF